MDSIRIELGGIREGMNHFAFRVDPEEIDLEEEGSTYRKPIDVAVRIARTGATISLSGSVKTEVERVCARCLAPFDERLDTEFLEALRIEREKVRVFDDRPDATFLSGRPGGLALDEIVREAILVCSPMKPICRDDCRGFCPVCGKDRNRETCSCRAGGAHHVWDALRGLTESREKRE